MNQNKTSSPDKKIVKVRTDRNFLGKLKLIITILIILIQLIILGLLYYWFIELFRVYLLISFILSFITILYVISSNKNGYSKAVWTLFLLLFFYIGYFIYWISDERFFFKKSRKKYELILNNTKVEVNNNINNNININIVRNCNYLFNIGNFITYNNTLLKFFPYGSLLFDDILMKLKEAKKFIFIEYFIIADGVLLKRFLDILKIKAKENVDIRIIYDDLGSFSVLSRKIKKEIINSGIKLKEYCRLAPIFNVTLNYRDHRKIVVIDGNYAYTGGCNLADEYINEKRMYGFWKDCGIRLEGNGVNGFSKIFLRQWEFLINKKIDYSEFYRYDTNMVNNNICVPFADGLDYKNNIGLNMYLNLITNAYERIYIMTPYFVPVDAIINLLVNKALSGVDVRIVIPDVADKKFVYLVTKDNVCKLLKYGIKVYKMKNSFVHSKICITEKEAIVGSINFDMRSFYQQFECGIYFNDLNIIDDILNDFNDTFNKSIIMNSNNNILEKILVKFLRLFSPLM